MISDRTVSHWFTLTDQRQLAINDWNHNRTNGNMSMAVPPNSNTWHVYHVYGVCVCVLCNKILTGEHATESGKV